MSTNGGTSWSAVNPGTMSSEGIHPDFHAIAFAAGAGKLYIGDDGGMWSTTHVGSATSLAWTNLNATLAITQFYPGLSISLSSANVALDGTQDNDTELYRARRGRPCLRRWRLDRHRPYQLQHHVERLCARSNALRVEVHQRRDHVE